MFWGGVRARLKSPPSWPTLPSSTGAAAMEVNEVCGEPKPGVVAVSMFCWENGGIKKNTEKTHGEGEKWKAFEETDREERNRRCRSDDSFIKRIHDSPSSYTTLGSLLWY